MVRWFAPVHLAGSTVAVGVSPPETGRDGSNASARAAISPPGGTPRLYGRRDAHRHDPASLVNLLSAPLEFSLQAVWGVMEERSSLGRSATSHGRVLQLPPFRVIPARIVAWAAAARRLRVAHGGAVGDPGLDLLSPSGAKEKPPPPATGAFFRPAGLDPGSTPTTAPPWATLCRLSEAAQTGRFRSSGLRWYLPDAPTPQGVNKSG